MSWPARRIKDPAARLSERELDHLKFEAQTRMRAAADLSKSVAVQVAEISFVRANVALLECRTEEEVACVSEGFTAGMAALKEEIDGVDREVTSCSAGNESS
jgi:phage host-nuclease inhibitor protein Gam